MALLADGFHMATHAGALGIAAAAYAFARRHVANPRFTFGTGKVGDLAGFASALVLAVVALGIAWESALRLAAPRPVDFADATLVAILGLAVNVVSALLLSGGSHRHAAGHAHHHHDHHHHGHSHSHGRDNNMRAAYLHVLADALTSVLAIGALLAGRYLGWVWLDPAIGIIGALVIARWSWSLMRDTAAVLLDTANAALADEVRACIEGPGDARICDLHVWRIGPEAHAAVLSVASKAPVAELRRRLDPIRNLPHVTIEVH
jgi:cation diffusion facilitator family transporter